MPPKISRVPKPPNNVQKRLAIRKQLAALKRKSRKIDPVVINPKRIKSKKRNSNEIITITPQGLNFDQADSAQEFKSNVDKEEKHEVVEEEVNEQHDPAKDSELHSRVLSWLMGNDEIKVPASEEDLETEFERIFLLKGISSGVQSLLTSKEFTMLRHPEWRLTIDGNQFIILGNQDKGDSFYRALSQAITSDERNCGSTREQLCQFVTQTKWSKYEAELRAEYRKQDNCPLSIYAKPKEVAKLYRHEQLKQKKPGSYFQLRVASELYKFNFVLVFKRRSSFTWVSFTKNKQNDVEKGQIKDTFIFLVWPKEHKRPLWKLLVPHDSNNIHDGDYPLFIKRTFVVQQCCYSKSTSNIANPPGNYFTEQEFPNYDLVYKVVTFEAGKEEFAYPIDNLRYPRDLYSMLSIIFFENVFHADEIQAEILEHRQRFGYFINLNPKRKYSSNIFITHYRQDWGDAMDLKIAASIYKFCYTLIAMDRLGNLSHVSECRDRQHVHENWDNEVNFLALFTRVMPTKIEWFKLEHFRSHRSGQEQFQSAIQAIGDYELRTVARSAFSFNMTDFSSANVACR